MADNLNKASKIVFITIFSLILSLLLSFYSAQAQTTPFAVKVVGQNRQSIVQRKVYPGQSIKIKLFFSNNSSKVQHISITSHTAFTGDAGIIQYNLQNPGNRYFGKIDFNKLLAGPQKITLNAHETTTKMYTLKSPHQHFNGTVLGGIYISQLFNQQSKGNDSSKNRAYVGYKNILAYEIPIILKQNNRIVHTKLKLQKIICQVNNSTPVVLARIANITPTVFSHLKLKTKIISQRNKKVAYQSNQENISMSPLSYFDNHLLLNKSLSAGRYVLKIKAQSGKRRWSFSKTFKINARVAQATQTKNHKHYSKYLLALIIISIIILIFLFAGAYRLGKRQR
ncbi:DUF3324 domain-containing protein [Lactiplantibacillus plantarum]|uniref:DUF3324 domain-containing protein n=1 Tax=Lactiplantibacillus plantarum TaxID=1590 RepID=UPI0019398F9C|nr:DUF3324 domain-containing protein [Lactiplantibacillus plantarum]QRG96261.1 DUF3324 domain-containing protein [Lactiplantibacillus plantarum]QRG96278.1 DUF3324 domain-containing protein [Lactiplantibacillus plantarum]